jgi:hypothetical protein
MSEKVTIEGTPRSETSSEASDSAAASAKDLYIRDPDLLAQLAAHAWIVEQINAGRLEEYRGQHVAVYGDQIVGADVDPLRLSATVLADQRHLEPARLVIAYVDDAQP